MLIMCCLPIRTNERLGKIVVLHAWLTAIHVLVELHTYGVDAMQVVEHVWSALLVSGSALMGVDCVAQDILEMVLVVCGKGLQFGTKWCRLLFGHGREFV